MKNRLAIEATGGNPPPSELPPSGRLVLGSGPKADYRIEGQGVAELHCAIGRAKGGGWAIKDLGSEFGTYVNGQKIGSARLTEGDTILVGSRRLTVFDPSGPRPEVEEAPARDTAPAADRAPADMRKAMPAAPEPAQPAASPTRTTNGSKDPHIAGYRVERLLGRGGMGHVFLAEQTSLSRRVALKVLSPRLAADTAFVQRFRDEARAAAALNHPNVVTIYDVGEDVGHHYLSMEYMERGCLETRLASLGPIPWREALNILHDAASGLVYAESRGIVHRDIKPANLMQNEVGTTKIADLGLAVQQETVQTGTRRVLGTPHFMAPEVIRGEAADARSDLYSLGASAYRLLSGHTPFEGADTKSILRSVLKEEPPPLRDEAPDVPEDLARVVHRLLAKDPEERHPSAALLVHELDALRKGGGSSGAPLVVQRRSPVLLLAGGFLAIVLAALAVRLAGPWSLGAGEDEGGARESQDSVVRAPRERSGFENELFPPPEPQDEKDSGPSQEELRLFEANAKNAYLELKIQQLPDAERVERLRGLALVYAGTDIARQAQEEAGALAAELASAEAAEAARATRLAETFGALREAADLDASPLRPGAAVRALLAFDSTSDADVEAERKRLLDEVLERAAQEGREVLAQARRLQESGRFDEVRSRLESFIARATLPGFPEDTAPPGVVELEGLMSSARAHLAGLARERASFARRRAREDRTKLASGLSAGRGLASELRALDLAAAEERLESLAGELHGAFGSELLDAWRADVEASRSVLATLGKEASASQWRRQTILDPRAGRPIEAQGGDAQGLFLPGAGSPEHVPWSAWGGRPKALHQLFHARLKRDWTAEELKAIASLTRLTAVVAALEPIEAGLVDPGRFSARDREALEEAFEDALAWGRESSTSPLVEAEHAALGLLADGLSARQEGALSLAIHAFEKVLEEHADTLTVSLVSDGSQWRVEPLEPATSDVPQASAGSEAAASDGD